MEPQLMSNNQPLAIIGLGCRFPGGVTDANSYWQLLIRGGSGITEVPANRWNWQNYYHPNSEIPGRMVTKWGGFLDDHNKFDGQFFGLSPREINQMDVQQRWLLETSWEALENAGMTRSQLKGSRVGVFVGISSHDQLDIQRGDISLIDIHTGTGNALSIAANRISYFFDFKGPSLAVDTACSSALVAVQLACQSIWSGDSTLALACGVNAVINPNLSLGFSRASMLSPTGTCYAFDHRANGYVRGEGVGVILIKPLDQAEADGDRIHAVIRAAVVNQDGHSSSLTIPNMISQEAMLREAYQNAGIDTRHVSYVEAHGTGTPVGDPIEARALGHVLGKDRPADDPCLIGSVKTNIGHLESASGMAGLIKACLILQHQIIPPHLNFEKANPHIEIDQVGLDVPTEARPLPEYSGHPVIVGVNSFGFGGTNAHVVLEQAPLQIYQAEKPRKAARPYVLPLSASDEPALLAQAEAYLGFLRTADLPLAQITAMAGQRRDHLHQRLVVIGDDTKALRSALLDHLNHTNNFPASVTGTPLSNPSAPVFVFTGQGPQWWGMGQQLMEREPVFRGTLEQIDALLRPISGWSLLEEMMKDEEGSRIDDTDIAQPAIFALQVALAEMWAGWGIRPSKVVGHSVGEVAAAYVAGIYSLADATTIIYHRSRLQHQTGGEGAMFAVGVSFAEAETRINSHGDVIQVAAANSPSMVTLSGESAAVEALAAQFEAEGKFVRRLPINYAFHSYQMDPIQAELLTVLTEIQPMTGTIPLISTVTADAIAGETMNADYWWRNVRQPVRFADAINMLIQAGETTYLEVGPHPSLQHAVQECMSSQGVPGKVFHSLRRNADESMELLGNLAGLHVYGIPVDWSALNQSAGNFVGLPMYQWQRQMYWYDSRTRRKLDLEPYAHPLLGKRIAAPHPTWQLSLDPRVLGWLSDHKLWDHIVFPAAGYAEMALAVARILFPQDPYVVEALEMKKALFVSTNQLPTLQTVFHESDKSVFIYSSIGESEDWQLLAQGKLSKLPGTPQRSIDVAALQKSMPFLSDGEVFYKVAHSMGYQWEHDFQGIKNVWGIRGQVLAEIEVPDTVGTQLSEYHLHPALLDACAQTFSAAGEFIRWMELGESIPFLPARFGRIRLFSEQLPSHLWVQSRITSETDQAVTGDIYLFDESGMQLAEITDYRFDRVTQEVPKINDIDARFYQLQWLPKRLKGVPLEALTPEAVITQMKASLPVIRDQHPLDDYFNHFVPQLDTITLHLIQNTFLELGWSYSIGRVFSQDELMLDLGIIQRWQYLIYIHLEALAAAGFLRTEGVDKWQVTSQFTTTDLKPLLDNIQQENSKYAVEMDLIKAFSSQALAQVLRGRLDPLVLFSTDGSNLLNGFQQNGSEPKAVYQFIESTVRHLIEGLAADRPLRVLELNAGAGALLEILLPLLPPDRTEYTFTDLSSKAILEAKQKFSDYSFVKFQNIDLASESSSQNLDSFGYDLILKANVIETEIDPTTSIMATASLLAPNGLFIFSYNESHGLTLGTISALLGDDPVGNKEDWQELLADDGFREINHFPMDDEGSLSVFTALAPIPKIAESKPVLPETILLLGDQQGISEALRHSLRAAGQRVITAIPGPAFSTEDAETYVVNPMEADHLDSLLAAVNDENAPLGTVLYAWGLDHPPVDDLSGEQMILTQKTGVLFIMQLAHALDRARLARPPQVVLLSRDTQSVLDEDRADGLANAPLIGFLRVANNEMPAFCWRLIDLNPDPVNGEVEDILHEIAFPDGELEIAYRKGRRHVNRLLHVKPSDLPQMQHPISVAEDQAFRLQFDKPGLLTNLSINQTIRQQPKAGEIEVRVQAGGLNFRDVMKVLGMYPGNPRDLTWLGDDFAGTVISTSADVADFKPGDAVVGLAPYAFRSHLTIDHRAVFKKSSHMSFEDAATLPTVFLTAYYAIVHLARMRPGERILIHAGTGGVGQAAIQVAQDLGLEIFATAGSPEKRALLMEQGVEHVFDSRTLNFADDILRVTNGQGVDAVLNSLAGDFIPKNFSVLAPFGRYLEIGKIDVYNNSKIGLEALRSNISVFIIDLAQLMEHRPQEFSAMLDTLRDKFEQGIYRPIPHRDFPLSEAVEAFRYMASGKHIGKNILTFDEKDLAVGTITEAGSLFRADASYLITGGAGGVGLEVAKWMAQQGARHLVLFSRSGPPDEAAHAAIDVLRANGVQVTDARGDVTQQADVERVVHEIQQSGAPLAGVIHGAMVLQDSLIVNMNEASFNNVFLPKMLGAWNLHRATLDIPLDYFISFSSISSIIGTGGQANYCAGNAFLDVFASYRRARGLPALTINWGVIGGAGVVSRDQAAARYLNTVGVKAISLPVVLTSLQTMLGRDVHQICIASVDWPNISRYLLWVANSGVFDALIRQEGDGGSNGEIAAQIIAMSPADRHPFVEAFISRMVAKVLNTSVDQINRDTSLMHFGLDSLMTIELINSISTQLNLILTVSDMSSNATISEVAAVIVDRLLNKSADSSSKSGSNTETVDLLNLNDDQIDLLTEAILASDIQLSNTVFPPVSSPCAIFLTGATGFLGAYLLSDLLKGTNAEVHCLVRASDHEHGMERLRVNLISYGLWSEEFAARIQPIIGDLALPAFGLGVEQYEALAEQIDTIYHNGAQLNLIQPYAALKPTNVSAVEEILRMAGKTRIKRVHYISTIAVFLTTDMSHHESVSEMDIPDPAGLRGGYTKSKWVAEQLVRQAIERGIPCTIYRPGVITGDSQTGRTNTADLASRIVMGSYQLGMHPDRNLNVNIVPVDFVSRGIVYLSALQDSAGQVFHLTNPRSTSLSDLVKWSDSNHYLREVSYPDWRNALIQQAQMQIKNDLLPLLPLFPLDHPERIEQPINSQQTLDTLAEAGIECPAVEEELVRIYLSYLIESGFLEVTR
jgi:thioester reductase-like protein